jgi:outer membrane protein assembly factor BamB
LVRIYIDSGKVILYGIVSLVIITGLILTYNFLQFIPDLNQPLINALSEKGWFYSPEKIYFITKDNYLFAKEVKTERIIWEFELSKDKTFEHSVITPVFAGDMVCFALGNTIHALDINTGIQKWIYISEDIINYYPDIDDKVIYFANRAGYFHAVNVINGKEKWRFNI